MSLERHNSSLIVHVFMFFPTGDSKFRLHRLKSALLEIGTSVLAASVTTFLACVPLFFTYVLFFYRFGVFIALTVL